MVKYADFVEDGAMAVNQAVRNKIAEAKRRARRGREAPLSKSSLGVR